MRKEPQPLRDDQMKWEIIIDGIFVGIVRDHVNLRRRINRQGIKGIEIKPVYI